MLFSKSSVRYSRTSVISFWAFFVSKLVQPQLLREFSFCVMDFHSIIFKSSASNFRGVPERDPSLDIKIIGFKLILQNQYLQVLWAQRRTKQIDSHALMAFLLRTVYNVEYIDFRSLCQFIYEVLQGYLDHNNKWYLKLRWCQLFKNAKKREFIWSLNNYTRALKKKITLHTHNKILLSLWMFELPFLATNAENNMISKWLRHIR